MMSSWDGVDEFLAVAASASFSRGAKALGVSATHVSRAIMALERRVQAQLFHRTTRSVRLTDTGKILFERCQRIAQERDEAFASINEQGEPQGELRVTCSTSMGERFVAPILRRFATRNPKLSVSIDLTNRVVDLVSEGFDLAVRTGKVTDTRLIASRVASRRLLTCASPTYLTRMGRPTEVEDLDNHDRLIGTSANWHYKSSDQNVVYRAAGRFRCNSGQAIVEACVAGLGVCQLPDFYILPFLKTGMIELLLEDDQPDEEPVWAVYPLRRHLTPKVQQAVDCLMLELGPIMNNIAPMRVSPA